jgi:D-alanyl-D-alanine carboxypeptidase
MRAKPTARLSGSARAVRAAQLLERGFGGTGLSWLRPTLGSVESLAPIDANPPNLRDEMCNGKRKRPATDEDDASTTMASSSASGGETGGMAFFTAGLQAPMPKPSEVLLQDVPVGEPMVVYTGPKKQGAALIAAIATDSEKQTTRRGKRSRVAAKKPEAADKLLKQPEVVDYFLKYVRTEGADKAAPMVITKLETSLVTLQGVAKKDKLTLDDVQAVYSTTGDVLALL